MGNQYVKSNELLSFDNHQSLCSFAYGTHLASIHETVPNVGAGQACGNGFDCFIGLTDRDQEGTFLWNDGSLFDFGTNISGSAAPWATNEPNVEDCVVITGGTHKWSSVSCDSSSYYAVCAIPTQDYFTQNMSLPSGSISSDIGQMDILDQIFIAFDIVINAFNASLSPQQIIKIGNNINESYPLISIDHLAQMFKVEFSSITNVRNHLNISSTALLAGTVYHIQFAGSQNRMGMAIGNDTVADQYIDSHSILRDKQIYIGNEYVSISALSISTSHAWDYGGDGVFNYLCDYDNRFNEISGIWTYDDNACSLTSDSNNTITWLGDLDPSSKHWINYKIEAIINISDEGRAGIIFRAQVNNHYLVFIEYFNALSNQRISVAKQQGNQYNQIHAMNTSITKGQDYKLRVEVDYDVFDVYLNNNFLFKVNDTSFNYGSIGLFAKHPNIIFKSLRIIIANATMNPTTDPTMDPTTNPTINPSIHPTKNPTTNPTFIPTLNPTTAPTLKPTTNPTLNPTIHPTANPTFNPTIHPSLNPTSDQVPYTEDSIIAGLDDTVLYIISVVAALIIILLIVAIICCWCMIKKRREATVIYTSSVSQIDTPNTANIATTKGLNLSENENETETENNTTQKMNEMMVKVEELQLVNMEMMKMNIAMAANTMINMQTKEDTEGGMISTASNANNEEGSDTDNEMYQTVTVTTGGDDQNDSDDMYKTIDSNPTTPR